MENSPKTAELTLRATGGRYLLDYYNVSQESRHQTCEVTDMSIGSCFFDSVYNLTVVTENRLHFAIGRRVSCKRSLNASLQSTESTCIVVRMWQWLCTADGVDVAVVLFLRIGSESVPIQLTQCRFRRLAISNAKISIYFSNKIYGSNFIKQHSETVMVWN